MEKLLKSYLENFFTSNEKQAISISCNNQYKNSEASEWLDAENRFKKLLNCGDLNDFYLEIADSCSFFINKLFNKYVDDNTFVIGAIEHSTIQNNLNNSNNRLVLHYDTVQKFDIDTIIKKYKESNCNKILIYITGILEMRILPISFCMKLKQALTEENIEHIMILDDVQSMFLMPKEYNVFDHVLFTCHSLLPNFDSGIMLSKKIESLGYQDAKVLNEYLDALEVFLSKRDKLYLFTFMLQQYYAEEISNSEVFSVPMNTSYTNFYLQLKNTTVCNIISKHMENLNKYGIDLGETILTIRGPNFILQDPEYSIEGLVKLKKILQKCIKLKDRL